MIKDNETKLKSFMDTNARLEKVIKQIQEQMLMRTQEHFMEDPHPHSLVEDTPKSPSDVSSSSIIQNQVIKPKKMSINYEVALQAAKNISAKRPSFTGAGPGLRKGHQKSESTAIGYVPNGNQNFFGALSNSTLIKKDPPGISLGLKKKVLSPEPVSSGLSGSNYSGRISKSPLKFTKVNKSNI